MGSVVSHVRQHAREALIRAVLRILALVSPPVRRLLQRLAISPGIPADNPCDSYWMSPPAPIAKHGAGPGAVIPEYVDVVIIGSGITGTSIARTLLDYDDKHRGENRPLQVVMLEARDACSGATGRNGGHITPVLYQDYAELRKSYGPQIAAEIIRFRLSHLTELLAVATEENLLDDSQGRKTRSYDVFQDSQLYRCAKDLLEVYKRDLPAEGADYQVIEGQEAFNDLQLVPSVVGCLASSGGAIHPYRLVTGILARLLRCYESSFQLLTHTPCTNVLPPSSVNSYYTICTPKGMMHAQHVIHATNAWASHLLPGMRGKIVPARGVMTAQAARPGLGKTKCDWRGTRSFVLFPGSSFMTFDYLTQQLPGKNEQAENYPAPAAEMMLGGGFMKHHAYLTEIGNADDSGWNSRVSDYLSTAMANYFQVGDHDEKDTVLAIWGGILGVSTDERPWVGRIPESITGRKPMFTASAETKADKFEPSTETLGYEEGAMPLAAPGEWMAAGYSGEGMVHAWMSGKALAMMILGIEQEWMPKVFEISEERAKEASIEGFIGRLVL